MFTGIIEECGKIVGIRPLGTRGKTVEVRAKAVLEDLKVGSSIAVNGVCLTTIRFGKQTFFTELSTETVRRTTFSKMSVGTPVNLERPMSAQARFGGHIVQGHIDTVGRFVGAAALKDSWMYAFEVPIEFLPLAVFKGSIAIDGVSLTIAELETGPALQKRRVFRITIAIIPHTHDVTNFKTLKRGQGVNLEFDVVAKYVQQMLEKIRLPKAKSSRSAKVKLTVQSLRQMGF
ncbi:MAG: riboflavin synthase [Acidobacteriia bacterium]|nr:riboflavin synthase [Terriglobia bacterium]